MISATRATAIVRHYLTYPGALLALCALVLLILMVLPLVHKLNDLYDYVSRKYSGRARPPSATRRRSSRRANNRETSNSNNDNNNRENLAPESNPSDEDDRNRAESEVSIQDIDYRHYRHQLLETMLRKYYDESQPPGQVVMNNIHLNSLDSRSKLPIGATLGRKLYDLDCFGFADLYDPSRSSRGRNFSQGLLADRAADDPMDHFLVRGDKRPIFREKSIDAQKSSLLLLSDKTVDGVDEQSQDQSPELDLVNIDARKPKAREGRPRALQPPSRAVASTKVTNMRIELAHKKKKARSSDDDTATAEDDEDLSDGKTKRPWVSSSVRESHNLVANDDYLKHGFERRWQSKNKSKSPIRPQTPGISLRSKSPRHQRQIDSEDSERFETPSSFSDSRTSDFREYESDEVSMRRRVFQSTELQQRNNHGWSDSSDSSMPHQGRKSKSKSPRSTVIFDPVPEEAPRSPGRSSKSPRSRPSSGESPLTRLRRTPDRTNIGEREGSGKNGSPIVWDSFEDQDAHVERTLPGRVIREKGGKDNPSFVIKESRNFELKNTRGETDIKVSRADHRSSRLPLPARSSRRRGSSAENYKPPTVGSVTINTRRPQTSTGVAHPGPTNRSRIPRANHGQEAPKHPPQRNRPWQPKESSRTELQSPEEAPQNPAFSLTSETSLRSHALSTSTDESMMRVTNEDYAQITGRAPPPPPPSTPELTSQRPLAWSIPAERDSQDTYSEDRQTVLEASGATVEFAKLSGSTATLDSASATRNHRDQVDHQGFVVVRKSTRVVEPQSDSYSLGPGDGGSVKNAPRPKSATGSLKSRPALTRKPDWVN